MFQTLSLIAVYLGAVPVTQIPANFAIIKNNFMCMMTSYGYYRKTS